MKHKIASKYSFVAYYKNSLLINSKTKIYIEFLNMLNFKPIVYILIFRCHRGRRKLLSGIEVSLYFVTMH